MVGRVRTVERRLVARMSAADRLAARLAPLFTLGSRRARFLSSATSTSTATGWIVHPVGLLRAAVLPRSIGFGLGALIGTVPGPGGEPISYQLFVAPALLASAAMNGAITEATFNFFFKLRYNKTFDAILSTPLSAGDIAVGELVWALIRGGLYAIGFLIVMAGPRADRVAVADPRRSRRALLIGFAFGAVGMAATSFMRTWQDFDLIQLVILPMFLFSAHVLPDRDVPAGPPD